MESVFENRMVAQNLAKYFFLKDIMFSCLLVFSLDFCVQAWFPFEDAEKCALFCIERSRLHSKTEKRRCWGPHSLLHWHKMETWKLVRQLPLEEGTCQLSTVNIYWGLTQMVVGMRKCQINPQKVMLFQVKYRFDCNVFPLVLYFFISLEI